MTVAPIVERPREWSGPKPRMVFFRINELDLPEFINGHFRDHVRCLEQFFDVVVIEENADYDEVVDRVQPKIALFESGVYARVGRRISNTHRHPDIPKLGFLDADAYCPTRSVFLSDMDDWGVETFFSIAVSVAGYTPDIADCTFVWPNFADRAVFHTYSGGKTQSILLSGSRESNYPWRVRVDRLLRENFPVQTLPHAGWFAREAAAAMPSGEAYARSLSSSRIVPTCGTIAGDLVRKHFEIPAAGSLLLTERTSAVEAAGFVDMDNCVFADDSDVVDKVEFLLANPDTLDRISSAGQTLAHSLHSIENRDQIRQWYELHLEAKSGHHVVQPDLFGPLRLAGDKLDGSAVSILTPPGVDRLLLADASRLLDAGHPARAADSFAEVLNYHFEPEAALGLARSNVALGRPKAARQLLEYSTSLVLRGHGATHADPVEWAWLIRSALCDADLQRASELALQYGGVRHPELDRIRSVAASLTGDRAAFATSPRRRSVHVAAGESEWSTWAALLADDLRLCGQNDLAQLVNGLSDHSHIRAKPMPPGPSQRRANLHGRRFVRRVMGRVEREWAKLRGHDLVHDRTSIFQLLGGRGVANTVMILVDPHVAQRVEALVGRDPSAMGVVRVGRTLPQVEIHQFAPRGLRSGVRPEMLHQLPLWEHSIVITGSVGAAMLTTEMLSDTVVLVIAGTPGVGVGIEMQLTTDPGWRVGSTELASGFARALEDQRVRVWERLDCSAGRTRRADERD